MTFKVVTTTVMHFENGKKISDVYPLLNDYEYSDEIEYCSYRRIGMPYRYIGKIDISSIEQLMELKKAVDCELVITGDDSNPEIEIYDSYRE